jgi:hypothetical protein
MLEILPGPDHLVAVRVGGRIEEADIDQAIAAIDGALERAPRISFYAEVDALEGMTASALAKDVRYGLGMLRKVDRLARAAVVTDEEWVRALARFEAWLIPRIEFRMFGADARAEALSWASEKPPAEPPDLAAEPAIRLIETGNPMVLAFEVDGYITGRDVERVAGRFLKAFAANDGVRVLGRFKHLPGVDVATLMHDRTLSLKLQAMQRVERYAVVGGPEPLKNLVALLDPLFKLEMRHFEADDEPAAWAWLEAAPKET